MIRILFFGDIVGQLGRSALRATLPRLRASLAADFVIANVENLSHGIGITERSLREIEQAGVDAFTSGNHVWEKAEGLVVLNDAAWSHRLICPANMRREAPGARQCTVTVHGMRILLINLLGQLGMHTDDPIENPFHVIDTLLETSHSEQPDAIFIDFHAEMTAEKEAFAHYVDGRVTAVIGTHTHVQTSDAKLLPHGTAYLTDAGRVGLKDSVLGFDAQSAIERFVHRNPQPYELPATGIAEVDGVILTLNEHTKGASSIQTFRETVEISSKNR